MKQTVILRPPSFIAIRWDGDNEAEFADALSASTVDGPGTKLRLVPDSGQIVTLEQGQWAVFPASNPNLPAVTVLDDADFTAQYRTA